MVNRHQVWWSRTLATALDGEKVNVEAIRSSPIREDLLRQGIHVGSTLECIENRPSSILVRLPQGTKHHIPRDDAWFVSVLEATD